MTTLDKIASTVVPLHPLPAGRWSSQAFDPDHEVTDEQLIALLEAARRAPSASNTQPWRFAVTRRGTAGHAAVLEALAGGNQVWARAASALVVVAARTTGADGAAQPWAVYDAGQAVAHLSVQATVRTEGDRCKCAPARRRPAAPGAAPAGRMTW